MKTAQIIQQAPIKSNISNPYLSRLRDASVRGHNRGGGASSQEQIKLIKMQRQGLFVSVDNINRNWTTNQHEVSIRTHLNKGRCPH
jgi:hypothetical protein